MRALVQRVSQASVSVAGAPVGAIGAGLLVLVCAMRGDAPDAPQRMAAKIARLRIFRDDAGKMNRALAETGGAALVVSQFTLAADTRSGNRPGFSAAAPPDAARAACDALVRALQEAGIETATGQFGADMDVSLTNQGPVTIWLEV